MRTIVVELKREPPPARESKWSDVLREHLPEVLSTIVAAITGVLGYLFVTRFDHQLETARQSLETSKFAFEQFVKRDAVAVEREKLALARDRAQLDALKESLGNTSVLKDFVPKLLNPDTIEVHNAAITLAASGFSNTQILVAALGNKNQSFPDSVIVGLRISAARDRAATCDLLIAYGSQLDYESTHVIVIGNLAKAMGDLRCASAAPLLKQWSQGTTSIENVRLAFKRVCAAPDAKPEICPVAGTRAGTSP